MDFQKFATAVDETREALRAMVAGLVKDGFSDEQARQLIVAMFTMKNNEEEDDDD